MLLLARWELVSVLRESLNNCYTRSAIGCIAFHLTPCAHPSRFHRVVYPLDVCVLGDTAARHETD